MIHGLIRCQLSAFSNCRIYCRCFQCAVTLVCYRYHHLILRCIIGDSADSSGCFCDLIHIRSDCIKVHRGTDLALMICLTGSDHHRFLIRQRCISYAAERKGKLVAVFPAASFQKLLYLEQLAGILCQSFRSVGIDKRYGICCISLYRSGLYAVICRISGSRILCNRIAGTFRNSKDRQALAVLQRDGIPGFHRPSAGDGEFLCQLMILAVPEADPECKFLIGIDGRCGSVYIGQGCLYFLGNRQTSKLRNRSGNDIRLILIHKGPIPDLCRSTVLDLCLENYRHFRILRKSCEIPGQRLSGQCRLCLSSAAAIDPYFRASGHITQSIGKDILDNCFRSFSLRIVEPDLIRQQIPGPVFLLVCFRSHRLFRYIVGDRIGHLRIMISDRYRCLIGDR